MGCRVRRPQDQLVRLALRPDSGRAVVTADPGRRLKGRGAWVCTDSPSCLAKAALKGRLARALRVSDPDLSALEVLNP
ncbi:MAG: YlxR family protein [Deltaproteobacteria bacterium]|nr:YlxR family protein [Deltaproteobacteria bacterium]